MTLFLTCQLGNGDAPPAPLNARSFWTNGSSVRLGGPVDASLHGTRSRLGGEPFDRIGWGRLRSSASAERSGWHGLLNVDRAAVMNQFSPQFRGTHRGTHDDLHGRQIDCMVSRRLTCTCVQICMQVSGNRIDGHIGRRMEWTDGA